MQTAYEINNVPDISGAKIAILQAKWYSEITDGLVRACLAVLDKANCPKPEHHIIPGSLELPLAAQTLIKNSKSPYDAIICVGAILKGETLHFEMIVDECIRGLGRVMLDHDTPIIVEVIPLANLDQLRVRCADNNLNKGLEAGLAAVEIISWRRSLKRKIY